MGYYAENCSVVIDCYFLLLHNIRPSQVPVVLEYYAEVSKSNNTNEGKYYAELK